MRPSPATGTINTHGGSHQTEIFDNHCHSGSLRAPPPPSPPHRPLSTWHWVCAASIMTSAGCGTAASRAGGPAAGGPVVIVVRDDANGKAVSARAGDRIELILSSSYWHVTGSSAPSVLRPDGPPVPLPRPSSCPDIPGLGCAPVRADFTALTDGKTVITAERSACGEALRCQPGQSRFTVDVVIRN